MVTSSGRRQRGSEALEQSCNGFSACIPSLVLIEGWVEGHGSHK